MTRFYSILVLWFFVISNIYGQKSHINPNFQSPFGANPKSKTDKSVLLSAKNIQNTNYRMTQIGNSIKMDFVASSSISIQNLNEELRNTFNLSNDYNFVILKTEKDNLGFSHYRLQETYKSIIVADGLLVAHEKEGVLKSVNGKIISPISISVNPAINLSKAQEIGELKANPEGKKLIKHTPELVICEGVSINLYKLAYKYQIQAESYSLNEYVYIDAQTGEVFKQITGVTDADVVGTANTLYSGTQTITTDSYAGSYRLRETGRPVETYNMQNGTNYGLAVDFTDNNNSWTEQSATIKTLTINNVATSWWYASIVDVLPDLYVVIKDGSNNTVYISSPQTNTPAPVSFSLNVSLVNPPYTLEIWDYDASSTDDFGGSYSLSLTNGIQSFSGNGNDGAYEMEVMNNPALDVHFGMEKTYDFYLNQLGRNSYDNAGSTIKSYVHYDNSLVNAFWDGQRMSFGDGDGAFMNSVTSIDVAGHEFSHAVVQHTANLQYQGESGGLNESFADIFGTAIEFYAFGANGNWLMGEDVMVNLPFLRSMSNPNGGTGPQPDTYNGQYWVNPNSSQDNGGVHTNSGVQNFWYYLVSQGGSGTNDIGNAYSVTGIGINKATQIAYRNLSYYLTANSNYQDAYLGALQSAEDLYGNPSAEYDAVRDAWYAVGLGNNPNAYCSGTTLYTDPTGVITDGSGNANYLDNASCKWVIAPPGATQITISFTQFNTEADYDTVWVYNGTDTLSPLLMIWSGNTLPPTITTTGGGALVRFKSDNLYNFAGWSLTYNATIIPPSCGGGNVMANATGTISDGSGAGNYGNNQLCYWLIAPPCASSVSLSFTAFNTEQNYDGVLVYNGNNTNAPLLGTFTGTTLPLNLTSGPEMLVVFISDYSTTFGGFSANYTSTGTPYCSGNTTLTNDYGTFSDGSNANNYCNNANCSWLIQPTGATSITLSFSQFDVEPLSTDGFTIYDAVEVFDGVNVNSPLLGRFAGNSLPNSITSTSGNMFVKFYTDMSETKAGWTANYTSTTNNYCTGNVTLTAPAGTFNDGSGANQYGNNAECSWLIQPTNAQNITLSFSAFNTEQNNDGVLVYDGINNSSPLLGSFTGSAIPNTVTSTGGAMYVTFGSNQSIRGQGFTANYISTTVNIEESTFLDEYFKVYPNPNSGTFKIQSEIGKYDIEILDMSGRSIYKQFSINNLMTNISLKDLSKGIYQLKISCDKGVGYKRLIIE